MARVRQSSSFFARVASVNDSYEHERIDVVQGLQNELTELFEKQAEGFIPDDGSDIVPFKAKSAYRLERGQIFSLKNVDVSAFETSVKRPHQQPAFSLNRKPLPLINCLFAGESSGSGVSRLLFQLFQSPQLLGKKFTILSSGSTFHKLDQHGLAFANELAAIYQDDTLYFRSLAVVSRFLNLEEYQPEADHKEIGKFVGHNLFDIPEMAKVFGIIENDSWLRRRVASILDMDILENVKPKAAKRKAKLFGIDIGVSKHGKDDKILLTNEKKHLKQTVKFLNEEYFHGELSNERYETNSLRRIGT
jgi:hypothetical protein